MTLTTDQKMMLLVLYAMGNSHGSFLEFCKAINGYDEEQINATFDSYSPEDIEQMMCSVDLVAGEIASVLKEFYVMYETQQNKEPVWLNNLLL